MIWCLVGQRAQSEQRLHPYLRFKLAAGVKCRFGGSVYGLKQREGCFARDKNLFQHDRVSEWHPNDSPLSTRSAARHDGRAASPTPTLASLSRTHARTKPTAESGIPPPAAEAAVTLYQDKTAWKRGAGGVRGLAAQVFLPLSLPTIEMQTL